MGAKTPGSQKLQWIIFVVGGGVIEVIHSTTGASIKMGGAD